MNLTLDKLLEESRGWVEKAVSLQEQKEAEIKTDLAVQGRAKGKKLFENFLAFLKKKGRIISNGYYPGEMWPGGIIYRRMAICRFNQK